MTRLKLPQFLLMLMPPIILLTVFTLWPLAEVVWLSLHNVNFIKFDFIGLANYYEAVRDIAFRQEVLNSLFYIALLIPLNVILSASLAMIAYHLSKRWQDSGRIILYVPSLAAGVILAQVWKWVFNAKGPINWILGLLHIPAIQWFSNGITSIPVIVFIVAFCSVGSNFIICLSSILSIDKSIFDAANIDGANRGVINRQIILPIIMPTVILIGFMAMLQAPAIFENIFLLAPQTFAGTMAYGIYQQGFQFGRYGYGAAQSVIMLVLMVGLSVLKNRLAK